MDAVYFSLVYQVLLGGHWQAEDLPYLFMRKSFPLSNDKLTDKLAATNTGQRMESPHRGRWGGGGWSEKITENYSSISNTFPKAVCLV